MIIGFRHWKAWGYGQQAVAMIRSFGGDLDEKVLRARLRKEGAEHAYGVLRKLAVTDMDVTPQRLDTLWHEHYR